MLNVGIPLMSSDTPSNGDAPGRLRSHLFLSSHRTPTSRDARLVSLNFKVPFEFRQRLKILAAQRAMTMTELLTIAVEAFVGANAGGDTAPSESVQVRSLVPIEPSCSDNTPRECGDTAAGVVVNEK